MGKAKETETRNHLSPTKYCGGEGDTFSTMAKAHAVGPTKRSNKSGRGLPYSKTLRAVHGREDLRQLLECACPLALS
jgi:hypothetical protein